MLIKASKDTYKNDLPLYFNDVKGDTGSTLDLHYIPAWEDKDTAEQVEAFFDANLLLLHELPRTSSPLSEEDLRVLGPKNCATYVEGML